MSTIVVTPPAAAALVAVLKPSLKLNTNVDKNEKKIYLENLPVSSPWFINMNMGIHNTRWDHQVSKIKNWNQLVTVNSKYNKKTNLKLTLIAIKIIHYFLDSNT